jgi:hypothetical protein
VAVTPFILSSVNEVASANVTVPIGSALVGLSASLAIAVVMADGSSGGAASTTTDFMTNPIFVLTPADLPGAS